MCRADRPVGFIGSSGEKVRVPRVTSSLLKGNVASTSSICTTPVSQPKAVPVNFKSSSRVAGRQITANDDGILVLDWTSTFPVAQRRSRKRKEFRTLGRR